MKPKAVIFDLDGTLCDDTERSEYARLKQWDIYHSQCVYDKPRPAEMLLLKMAAEWGLHILIVTGRTDTYKEVTGQWLNRQEAFYDELFMRGATDRRPATIVKRELYGKIIAPQYEVQFIVEDDPRLVAMWRALGLTCFQCQERTR